MAKFAPFRWVTRRAFNFMGSFVGNVWEKKNKEKLKRNEKTLL